MRHTPARLLGSLLNRPQLIEPAAGAAILSVLMPGARLDGYDGEPTNDCRDERQYAVINSIAVIPIVGELVFRGGYLSPASGCCSYQAIDAAIASAMADANVQQVVLDLDSPGGVADGCFDLARRIRGYRGIKPMTACINVRATSAAYAIGSACDRVHISPGGYAGSIGVVSYHTALDQALKDQGVTVTYIYAGARKIDGAPALPLSNDAAAQFQARVDQLYGDFCTLAAENRGLSVAAVRATEAAIFMGEGAIKAGLADRIMTLEDTLTAIAHTTAGPIAPTPPNTPPQNPGAPTAAAPLSVVQACNAAGMPALAEALLKSEATDDKVRQVLADCREASDACAKAGVPAMATPLTKAIAEGMSLETARALAVNAAAGRDQAAVTDSTRPPEAKGGEGPGLNIRNIYQRMNAMGVNAK